MKGVYILVMSLPRRSCIKIGSLGVIDFKKGFYAYTGSAMGGLEQRIRRHLRREKKLHWHVDYLIRKAEIREVHIKETDSKQDECLASATLAHDGGTPINKFGASDCRCGSHLFYFNAKSGIASNNETNSLRGFTTYRRIWLKSRPYNDINKGV
ncbi:MAG: GIY-YIG nuclease family protein [Lentisphaerae bacterium]|nr:GIY-YIG nuclease family protein [Lentisphaerota bacterium]